MMKRNLLCGDRRLFGSTRFVTVAPTGKVSLSSATRRTAQPAFYGCGQNRHLAVSLFSTTTTNNNNNKSSNKTDKSDETTNQDKREPILPLSSLSLGLTTTFVVPHLQSISQLPEVRAALDEAKHNNSNAKNKKSSHDSLEDGLQRAVDIFERMELGGNEHKALLALLAEHMQSRGKFEKVNQVLKKLAEYSQYSNTNPRLQNDVTVARAKALWLDGNFHETKRICDEMLNDKEVAERFPLHFAAARTGQALSRLTLAQDLDDAFTLRDPTRMALRFLEQNRKLSPLAIALAQLNHGCAHVIWADLVSRINNVDAPIDAAMRTWNDTVNLLERGSFSSNPLLHSIRARLIGNLAWGVLEIANSTGLDDTAKALELAGKAIREMDKIEHAYDKEGLCFILATAARCYQLSGQAVTAEGLLKSAMDNNGKPVVGPQQWINQREIVKIYSKLLLDWEKREAEGHKLECEEQDIENTLLATPWQGRHPISGQLWFWTPNLLVDQY